jgi:hypothetical protein
MWSRLARAEMCVLGDFIDVLMQETVQQFCRLPQIDTEEKSQASALVKGKVLGGRIPLFGLQLPHLQIVLFLFSNDFSKKRMEGVPSLLPSVGGAHRDEHKGEVPELVDEVASG